MGITHYNLDKYKVLEYKDFLTTKPFPYEFATFRYSQINPYVWSSKYKNSFYSGLGLSSNSGLVIWKKKIHNPLVFFNEDRGWGNDLKLYAREGRCRINLKDYHDNLFAEKTYRKNWVKNLHRHYLMFENTKLALQNTVNGYLRMCLTKKTEEYNNKAFNKIKYYLNSESDEYLYFYLDYIIKMYWKKDGTYSDIHVHDHNVAGGPYISIVPHKKSNKDLEVKKDKPMKRIRKTCKVLVRQKGISPFAVDIEGDVDLQISKDGGKFYNIEPIYNKAKGMYPKADIIVLKEVDNILSRLKKEYTPPKNRHFKVSWAKGGFDSKGLPKLQITNDIYGPSYKSALRKHKISLYHVIWSKEIDGENQYTDIQNRTLPINKETKFQKRRWKSKVRRAERNLNRVQQEVKDFHDSDRLVCIAVIKDHVIQNANRVPISQTKDGTYDMTEWSYIPKKKYRSLAKGATMVVKPKVVKVKRADTINRHRNNKVQVEIIRTVPDGHVYEERLIDKRLVKVKVTKSKEVKCKVYKLKPEFQEKIRKAGNKNVTITESVVPLVTDKTYIKPPEINQIKRSLKATHNIDKKIKRIKLNHEKELNRLRSKSKKGYYTFRIINGKEYLKYKKGKDKVTKKHVDAKTQAKRYRSKQNRAKREERRLLNEKNRS